MKITLKLFATLGEYLPPGANANTIDIDVPESTTPWGVLDYFQVPRARAHLVLVNGVYVPPSKRNERLFKDGDALAVWPPVAGG
jgi:sulfur carrier protein ThiS